MQPNPYAEPILDWYEAHARDLPWRRADATPWAILVSEIMLQQTPVTRVLPAFAAWLDRWPSPADLAAAPAGEAVRQWHRLGYPRRALNLHACARAIVDRHGGAVPRDYDQLRALPGIGEYTAAAVASFAYGGRHAILDTNVRRVLARLIGGDEHPPRFSSAAEKRVAEGLLPLDAPQWGVAVMELGALVCTARSPRCDDCPVRPMCRWHLAGRPPYEGPARGAQRYQGTDRHCRGRLLAVLRDTHAPVGKDRLDAVWTDAAQRERALDALIADGLVDPLPDGTYALPH